MSVRPRSAGAEAGFSLVEVVVALTILALLVTAWFDYDGRTRLVARAADARAEAALLAASDLAAAGHDWRLSPGTEEIVAGRFTLLREVSAVPDRPGLYSVRLLIRWPERSGEGLFTVESLRLDPARLGGRQ
ncbi:MAG: prepilin-type N-terminal cleavage/methylation domain-containing protein [Alphaproteobacteria bacterium]|nr:prepilin-type N-terminal cleavage/methylation domain-containing protein [Alphaproteobacteria bacterium]